jgi:tetratricopeptide (TPR) repeat protein
MKTKLLLFPAAMAIALLLAFSFSENKNVSSRSTIAEEYKKRNIVRCSPDWNAIGEWIQELDIPPLPGSGNHQWTIITKSDSAQFYFNQGINCYYGFHIIESMASFKKAARFDPASAMIQWAQALAYGPNINDLGYAASPDALIATGKAVGLSGNATEKEKILIQAQSVRYSTDSTMKREKLNQLYVDKMKEAYDKFSADADIAALYADALMLQHPWDLWKTNGTPKSWTPLIREVLEKLLLAYPDHPGANHYYIHVMEPSPYADKAIPSADRLGDLSPGLSHLVHMPSHIYLRTGNYRKGVEVNEKAVSSYKKYSMLYAPVTGNDFYYIIHNLHMQTNHAMMEGNSALSVQSAKELVNSIPKDYLSMPAPFGNLIQYVYMTPVLVHVRFGHWNELLTMPQPDSVQVYSNILYRFGRGIALAQQGKLREARHELESLRLLMKNSSLAIPLTPFSSALEGANVAENLLHGSIVLGEKKYEEAIEIFEKAVQTEENMVYDEPRDWLLSPKHYLGNAYLKIGKWVNARKVFQNDLRYNDENGWALFGLYQAFTTGNKKAEGERIFARFKKAFAKADTELHGPVF